MTVQTACDRCSQGVMDAGNDHLHGRCKCPCHSGEARPTPVEPEARDDDDSALHCGYFAPCEQDADHEGPHTAGMYPEWQVPTIEPISFDHPARRLAVEPDGLPLDVARLGFHGLLDLADIILQEYPPDTIVCSHSVKADKGALTTAAIADLIASCRLSGTPSEAKP